MIRRPCAQCGRSTTGTRCESCTGRRAFLSPCTRCASPTRNRSGLCDVHEAESAAKRRAGEAERHARQPWRAKYRDPAWRKNRARALKRARGQCEACGGLASGDDPLVVDHILPLSEEGTHDLANLAVLHRSCHRAKTQADRRRRSAG